MKWYKRAFYAIALCLDYGAELLVFWRTHKPMTISSKCGLALRRGETTTALARLGRTLNKLDPGHTDGAIKDDIIRAKAAIKELEG